ncbi:MAG: HD domain-containing protein [Candidatus Omnitrophica bacterium]|nr:HD domain-containing protein [Candidatus Omnitrophota bacterium]
MRAAVIDIGSNSTKLVIGESDGQNLRIIDSLKNVNQIGRSTFYKGRIAQDIFHEVISVLNKYKEVIAQYEVEKVKTIATTAVREAQNRDIFLDTVRRMTGFDVEILNVGDVVYYIDAFLSYKLKKTYPINEKNLLIVELGAGSLDISVMEKGFAVASFGMPLGTLRLKQFKSGIVGSKKEIYQALEEYVENEIINTKRSFPDIKIDDIILIDESYSTELHKVIPNKNRAASFFTFQFRESNLLISRIKGKKLDDLSEFYDIPFEHTEAIDGYAIVLNKLFKLLKKRSIYILETSLAEALLANVIYGTELAAKYSKENQLISVAKFLCYKFDLDIKHAKQVAFLSEELFKRLQSAMGLKDKDLLYLLLASYLHNIGLFINNRAHHKHTEYIINSLSLFRLKPVEIRCIACIARYHRKAIPQKSHFYYQSLAVSERILVQKLSSILRIANSLDASHKQKVKALDVEFVRPGEIDLVVTAQESLALERSTFADRKKFYEEISGSVVNLKVKPVTTA